jgi:hypothetical protein
MNLVWSLREKVFIEVGVIFIVILVEYVIEVFRRIAAMVVMAYVT